MAWKILTIIAIIVIGGASFFWWKNHDYTNNRMKFLGKKEATLATRNKEISQEKTRIVELNKSIVDLDDEASELDTKTTDAKQQLVQKQSEYSLLVTKEQDKLEKRDKFQNIADTGPEIEQLRREIGDTRVEIVDASTDIQVKEGVEEATTNENTRLKDIADQLVELRFNQQNAIISTDYTSRIKEAQNRWGFVVVEGGDQSGVVHNAALNVYRGQQFLCKLIVTEVKPNETVADIVPGTLPVGYLVKAGDIVKKADVPPLIKPSLSGSAPKSTGSAPKPNVSAPKPNVSAPKPASDPDPFGSDDPIGGSDDPFGGSDDPFGGDGF